MTLIGLLRRARERATLLKRCGLTCLVALGAANAVDSVTHGQSVNCFAWNTCGAGVTCCRATTSIPHAGGGAIRDGDQGSVQCGTQYDPYSCVFPYSSCGGLQYIPGCP